MRKTHLLGVSVSALMGLASSTAQAAAARQGAHAQGAYAQGPYVQGPYAQGPYVQGPYVQGPYAQGPYAQGAYVQGAYVQGPYAQGPYVQGPYVQGPYAQGPYVQGAHVQGVYVQGAHVQGAFAQGPYAQGIYAQGPYAQGPYAQGPYVQGTYVQGVNAQGFLIPGFGPAFTTDAGLQLDGVGAPNGEIGVGWLNGSQLVVSTSDETVTAENVIGTSIGLFSADGSGVPMAVIIRDATPDSDNNVMAHPYHADNSDVWLYKLTVPYVVFDDGIDPNTGEPGLVPVGYMEVNLCGSPEDDDDDFAMLFSTSITHQGYGFTSPTVANFACTGGTMAKAARNFGYKPWKSFAEFNGTGANLWLTMTNAAMANYCQDLNNSFTQNGTLVDVEDIFGLNVKVDENDDYAFAPESDWGGYTYNTDENGNSLTAADLVQIYTARHDVYVGHSEVQCDGYALPFTNPLDYSYIVGEVRVHTSRLCRHSPSVPGLPLNKACNPCTQLVFETHPELASCFYDSWTSDCVDAATMLCNGASGGEGYYSGSANELF